MELAKLIERIDMLGNKTDSEQNLRSDVTEWMLKELGYEERLFDREYRLCRDTKNSMQTFLFQLKEEKRYLWRQKNIQKI